MNLLKAIARSDGRRLAIGGLVSGAVMYGLVHAYPEVAWFAVPGAIVAGAFWCFLLEHLPEAVFKAVIAAVPVFLGLRIMPRVMAKDPSWWKLALICVPLGMLVGMAIGGLFGALCRLVWHPILGDPEVASRNGK